MIRKGNPLPRVPGGEFEQFVEVLKRERRLKEQRSISALARALRYSFDPLARSQSESSPCLAPVAAGLLTPQHPEYRALVPGQRHFSCEPLRATLSTADCARRWHAARGGSACHDYAIGRLHHGEHRHLAVAGAVELPQAVNSQRQRHPPGPACAVAGWGCASSNAPGICVSCSNREHEWRKGRNSKGTPPVTFQSLALVGNFRVRYWRCCHTQHGRSPRPTRSLGAGAA